MPYRTQPYKANYKPRQCGMRNCAHGGCDTICEHPRHLHSEGPRVPLRYGSAPTELCACGWYRINPAHAFPARWQPGPPNTVATASPS